MKTKHWQDNCMTAFRRKQNDMSGRAFLTAFSVFLFSVTSLAGQQGYAINLKITGAPESKIRLAYHLGNDQYIKDSTVTDLSGRCAFKGTTPLPAGVYMIVYPGNTFFEFLADKDQYFDIECSASDKNSLPVFRGSDENTRFIEYQKTWKTMQDEIILMNSDLKGLNPGSTEAAALRTKIAAQEKKMKVYLNEVYSQNRGMLLGAIARSLIPVENPAPDIPAGIAKRDSLIRLYSYLSYKRTFFDNIDFSEQGLIRSPIIAARLDQFFRQVVVQMPDSINKEADRILEKSKADKDMYQYVAVWLFNKYAVSEIMGHDAVVVHLADKIYLSGEAPWAGEEYIKDLAKKVERLRPNLIGKQAPDLVMDSYAGRYVALYDVRAEFTILYFWEPDCGHCKEATPVLKEYYDENKENGIEVFAVCTQSDKAKWEQYIREHKLNWINGWDPSRVTRFDILYNVDFTPIVYILDRNKKIIAKRLPVEKIGPFIESYRKYMAQSPGR